MTTDTSFPVAANVNNNKVMSGISEKRKRFSLGLKHSIQMEFGFVVKYVTKVRCAYGAHFVQNTANGCVAFATSATPSSTALLALLSYVMHCQRI